MVKAEIFSCSWSAKAVFVLACLFVLLVNGALPFVTLPTLGQAVWSTGFSQSFANNSIFVVHAHNFGAPQPAAISFGLAGAWVAALFIRLGAHAADAYTLMAALWLCLAFYGAYKVARFVGVSHWLSILAALSWGTMPVIWGHADYSMLSMGFALLPFYFWASLRLFEMKPDGSVQTPDLWSVACLYFAACQIAVFMDGYSFMMFAIGASILGFFLFMRGRSSIGRIFIHCACFLFAYLLYAFYIGRGQFEFGSLDFFRGWGADVSFFLVPTSGVHWIADVMGWSVPRSADEYFGDASVWVTTFCLPLALGALACAFAAKHTYKMGFVVIAIFGFYMSLGPSLKFYSKKPSPETSVMMESKYAIMATGSALLSSGLPGFKNMRASYRWAALGCMGAWALLVLAMSGRQRKTVVLVAVSGLVVTSAFNMPNLDRKFNTAKDLRRQFLEIDEDLVKGMGGLLAPKERVIFLPWRNDFLVNYLAAKLDFIAYNIGGDKNLHEARKGWPKMLASSPMGGIRDDFSVRVAKLLLQGDADAVVLPYIDMLWAAHRWPYPASYRDEMGLKIRELEQFGYFQISKENYYSIVRLKAEHHSEGERRKILKIIASSYCMAPTCLQRSGFTDATFSQVGIMEGRKIITVGKAGFLIYGPYADFNAGNYFLTVRGVAERVEGAWVDVVSKRGGVSHGKFVIAPSVAGNDVLVSAPIHLLEPVQDIEVRVHVGAGDRISLSGYELRPDIGKITQ